MKDILFRLKTVLKDKKGDLEFFDSMWKIVLCCVVGAALLGGCLYLFNEVVMPRVTDWTRDGIDNIAEQADFYIDKLFIGGIL